MINRSGCAVLVAPLVMCVMWADGQQVQPSAVPPASAPSSDTSNQATFKLQVNTQVVVLDVVVNDRKGEPVSNLSRDDFKVYEDKVPQTILSFEQSPSTGLHDIAINSTADLDRLEPNAPVSIIVLNEVSTLFQDQAFARYSLSRYLGSQGDKLAQPTMLVATNLQNMMVLRDYTTSKNEIVEALKHHFATYNWQAESGGWVAEQFGASFSSLMAVAEATAGHPGHKNMIWIGRGFPALRWDTLPAATVQQMNTLIATCTNLLRNARVTLYSVDPAGLAPSPITDGDGFATVDPVGGQVDFDTMAKTTGGQAFHGRNDVDNLIGTSVRDGEAFYTLSYRPASDEGKPKTFRNIKIVMSNPNLKATTREGYFTQSTEPPPGLDADGKLSKRLVFDLTTAGASLLIYDGLPFSVTRDTADPDRFLLALKADKLTWHRNSDSKDETEAQVLVQSFDKRGKLLNRQAESLTIKIPFRSAYGPDTRIVKLNVSIPTRPPAARVRIVLRADENGKVGATNVFLVNPKTLSDPATGLTNRQK